MQDERTAVMENQVPFIMRRVEVMQQVSVILLTCFLVKLKVSRENYTYYSDLVSTVQLTLVIWI